MMFMPSCGASSNGMGLLPDKMRPVMEKSQIKKLQQTLFCTVEKSLPLQQHPHDSGKGERPILAAFAAAGK